MNIIALLIFFGIRWQTGEYPVIPFLAVYGALIVHYLYRSADALQRMANRE